MNKKLKIPTCPGCGNPMKLMRFADHKFSMGVGWSESLHKELSSEVINPPPFGDYSHHQFYCECGWIAPGKFSYNDAYESATKLTLLHDVELELKKFKKQFYALRKAWLNLRRLTGR